MRLLHVSNLQSFNKIENTFITFQYNHEKKYQQKLKPEDFIFTLKILQNLGTSGGFHQGFVVDPVLKIPSNFKFWIHPWNRLQQTRVEVLDYQFIF